MSRILMTLLVALMATTSGIQAGETEQNKAVVRQLFQEVWQQHNSQYYHEITTTEFDRAAAIAFADTGFARFPDFFAEIVELIAEEDKVAVLWQAKGTNADPLTKGKTIAHAGVTWLWFSEGKIAEMQGFFDRLAMMERLGYTLQPPSPEPVQKKE